MQANGQANVGQVELPFRRNFPVGLDRLIFLDMSKPRIEERFAHFYFHRNPHFAACLNEDIVA